MRHFFGTSARVIHNMLHVLSAHLRIKVLGTTNYIESHSRHVLRVRPDADAINVNRAIRSVQRRGRFVGLVLIADTLVGFTVGARALCS